MNGYIKAHEINMYMPAYNQTDKHYVFEHGFNFAFRWTGGPLNEEAFKSSGEHFYVDSPLSINFDPIEVVPCTLSMFPDSAHKELSLLFIDSYYCLNATEELYLKANIYGSEFSKFFLNLLPCDP